MPLEKLRFETGRKVLDWFVPKEWKIEDAYFIDPAGVKHADVKKNNLHLVSYSILFKGKVRLQELLEHLHTLPEQPEAIPYVTSYYHEYWGFCISHNELKSLIDGEYEVIINSELYPGVVEIGETVLPGDTHEEVLFSTYLCHPSMANNELTGPLVMAFLYELIKSMKIRRYTYRFVVVPETIGTICYLSTRGDHLIEHMVAGYQMTCLGDEGSFTYKLSRREDSSGDRAAKLILRDNSTHKIVCFDPGNGSDERQYCSPGYNLPMGSLMRTMYSRYPEYHTSLDNKEFISFDAMCESIKIAFEIVKALESNFIWKNTVKFGEPQLGRRGLYPTIGTERECTEKVKAIMWFLNLSDGNHDLFKIAERSGISVNLLQTACEELYQKGLLVKKEK